MQNFEEYNPEKGMNWNAPTGVGGVWIRDGETAILRCPQCATAANLGTFQISKSGVVTPDFECPNCKWTDAITLNSWDEVHGKWYRPKFFAWKIGNATEEEVIGGKQIKVPGGTKEMK